MVRSYFLSIGLAVIAWGSYAADGVETLLGSYADQLSPGDRQKIYEQLKVQASENGKQFCLIRLLCDSEDEYSCKPFDLKAELLDLNRDGVPEVLVSGGDSCTSGMTGSSIWLFIKDAAGNYQMNLGFPAAAYEILNSMNQGFPELRFGGPGFCDGVWGWDGDVYRHLRDEPTEPGGCDWQKNSSKDRDR